jgi:hypothetical protein
MVLALLLAVVGAGIGFLGGYLFTAIERIRTDTQVACALLQVAENSAYITRQQRGTLVDEVVPARTPEPRPGADWIRRYADSWWDGIREDQKSGCPDV